MIDHDPLWMARSVGYVMAFKWCEERLTFPKKTPEAFILQRSIGHGLTLHGLVQIY